MPPRQFLYTGMYYDHHGQPRHFRRTSPHRYTHAILAYVTHDPRTGTRLHKPYWTSPHLVWWAPEDVRRQRYRLRRGEQAVRLVVTGERVAA
jgi:hypothetical protein